MKLVILAALVVVAVALPSRNKDEIADVSEREFLEDLEQFVMERAPIEKRAKRCSRKPGESCTHNCECCGASTVCGYHYVGGKEVNSCTSKTSNNAILNKIGEGWNAMANAASLMFCTD